MLEDIYSELTGKSVELDEQSRWELLKIGENQWQFDGAATFDFMKTVLSLHIPQDQFSAKTVNGVFCELLGAIPKPGDSVTFGNLTLFAKTGSKNRVTRVLVTVEAESTEENAEAKA